MNHSTPGDRPSPTAGPWRGASASSTSPVGPVAVTRPAWSSTAVPHIRRTSAASWEAGLLDDAHGPGHHRHQRIRASDGAAPRLPPCVGRNDRCTMSRTFRALDRQFSSSRTRRAPFAPRRRASRGSFNSPITASATACASRGSTRAPVRSCSTASVGRRRAATDDGLAEAPGLQEHDSEALVLRGHREDIAPLVERKLLVAGHGAQERDRIGGGRFGRAPLERVRLRAGADDRVPRARDRRRDLPHRVDHPVHALAAGQPAHREHSRNAWPKRRRDAREPPRRGAAPVRVRLSNIESGEHRHHTLRPCPVQQHPRTYEVAHAENARGRAHRQTAHQAPAARRRELAPVREQEERHAQR